MSNKKFQNKYRIESNRLKGYNYSKNGAYFVTINTKNRNHFFGEIVAGKMILNDIGEIVKNEWFLSEKLRGNIFMDEFVIMPNHIHGIVIIDNEPLDTLRRNVSSNVKRNYTGEYKEMSDISPQKSSLSHMIREFKSAVTKNSRKIDPKFSWQPNYYDHIIRNRPEKNRIGQYIIDNPQMWGRDRNTK